jgi:hypothetical protein
LLFVGIGIGTQIDVGWLLVEQQRAHGTPDQPDVAVMPTKCLM